MDCRSAESLDRDFGSLGCEWLDLADRKKHSLQMRFTNKQNTTGQKYECEQRDLHQNPHQLPANSKLHLRLWFADSNR
jgi:hypothetical protein